jgi:hypothetical protein
MICRIKPSRFRESSPLKKHLAIFSDRGSKARKGHNPAEICINRKPYPDEVSIHGIFPFGLALPLKLLMRANWVTTNDSKQALLSLGLNRGNFSQNLLFGEINHPESLPLAPKLERRGMPVQ